MVGVALTTLTDEGWSPVHLRRLTLSTIQESRDPSRIDVERRHRIGRSIAVKEYAAGPERLAIRACVQLVRSHEDVMVPGDHELRMNLFDRALEHALAFVRVLDLERLPIAAVLVEMLAQRS